jgi:2-oxoisovalerate dehydrogenase E1 component beta subunit
LRCQEVLCKQKVFYFLALDPRTHVFSSSQPKALYRVAEEEVPLEDYEIPLGKAEILTEGTDVTLIAYGLQMRTARMAAKMAEDHGISVEVIDLRTILPWDEETVLESVKKTGKCIITHEAPITSGFGAELASKI